MVTRPHCFVAYALVLASVLLICDAPPSWGTETLTIDCNDTLGVAGDPIVGGMNTWYDEVPRSRLYAIKPPFARGIWLDGELPMDEVWASAESSGATVIVGVESKYASSDSFWPTYWATSDDNCQDRQQKLDAWRAHVRDWVRYTETHRVVNGHRVPVEYDIWNEPDAGWSQASCYPSDMFYQVWQTAVDAIRDTVSDPITGPALSGVDGQGTAGITMDGFLSWTAARDKLPDILSWHDIYNSNPWSADMTGNPPGSPDSLNLYGQIKHARALAHAHSIYEDALTYEVNEMLDRDKALIPAYNVRNFALAQRAKHDGLRIGMVGISCWCDACQECSLSCEDCGYVQCSRLAGLLHPCEGDSMYNPRYLWWTYKAYADLTGDYVDASSHDMLDAISAVDLQYRTIRILAARNSTSGQDVHLVVKNIHPTLIINDAVRVSINRIHGDHASLTCAGPGLAPTPVDSANYPVTGDSIVIAIRNDDVAAGDVLDIRVTPIEPGFTIAPGTYGSVKAAILATDVGNTVILKPQTGGAAYQEDKIHLKNGVRVIAAAGDTIPRIQGNQGQDSVIVFPENANTFTTFEGIQVEAGPNSGVIVAFRGQGSIENCIVVDSLGVATYGIHSLNSPGQINGCKVNLLGSTSYDRFGVWVENGTTVVDSCSVTVPVSDQRSTGVHFASSSTGEVRHSFIKGGRRGIQLLGGSTAKFCTVDSTLLEGIYGYYSGSYRSCIENCIAAHALNVGQSGFGITGEIVNYCISTQFIQTFDGFQCNVNQDPLFCGEGQYTLRVDSYGNPENNECGEPMGAFPVACAWGDLSRNVIFSGSAIVPKDLRVPAGRSFTLSPGATLKFDDYDETLGGTYGAKTELIVEGTANIGGTSGSVLLTGADSTPNPDDWGGITVQRIGGSDGHLTVQGTTIEGCGKGITVKPDATMVIGPTAATTIRNSIQGVYAYGPSVSIINGLTTSSVEEGVVLLTGSLADVRNSSLAGSKKGIRERYATIDSLLQCVLTGGEMGIDMTGGSLTGSNSTFIGTLYDGLSASTNAVVSLTSSQFKDSSVGLFVDGGSAVMLSDATVLNSETGIWVAGGSLTMPTGGVDNCQWGIWVDDDGVASIGSASDFIWAPKVYVTDTQYEAIGISTPTHCSLERVAINGGSVAYWRGIHTYPGSDVLIFESSVSGALGNSAIGICVEGSAEIAGTDVINISKTLLGTGILIDSDSLDVVTVHETYNNFPQTMRNTFVSKAYFGFDIQGWSRPKIRNSIISDNQRFCVRIGYTAMPDLGIYPSDLGNNSIQTVVIATGKLAGGSSHLVALGNVQAQGNWWGNATPPADKISTWVDYSHYLGSNPYAPSSFSNESMVQMQALPGVSRLKAGFPSPFSGNVSVPYSVAKAYEPVTIAVYDLSGRRVRLLVSNKMSQGEHETQWDGRRDNGELAPNGVYFFHARIGNVRTSQRVVFIH